MRTMSSTVDWYRSKVSPINCIGYLVLTIDFIYEIFKAYFVQIVLGSYLNLLGFYSIFN